MTELFTFFAGVTIGGLLSWLITHSYYIKAGKDQQTEFKKLELKLKPSNTLKDFEVFLSTSTWTKAVVEHAVIWMADDNNTIQIELSEDTRDFQQPWTTVYPDALSTAYPVYLKINGITFRELTFISMDGGRIFVPRTERRVNKAGKIEYFWNLNSIEVKVCRVIGNYYIYNDLEGIAKHSNVTLIE